MVWPFGFSTFSQWTFFCFSFQNRFLHQIFSITKQSFSKPTEIILRIQRTYRSYFDGKKIVFVRLWFGIHDHTYIQRACAIERHRKLKNTSNLLIKHSMPFNIWIEQKHLFWTINYVNQFCTIIDVNLSYWDRPFECADDMCVPVCTDHFRACSIEFKSLNLNSIGMEMNMLLFFFY